MTHCLGYWLWQQGEAGPGLPEGSYWHKDEVEMATNVATWLCDLEARLSHKTGRRIPAFSQGVAGAASQRDSQQVVGHPETDKLCSVELWGLFPWFPFSSITFCGLWAMPCWVCNESAPNSPSVESISVLCRKWERCTDILTKCNCLLWKTYFICTYGFTQILGFGAFLQCTSFTSMAPGCIFYVF